jgi:CubicO group peptidase (beta-lactamase class C family)
VLVWPAGDHFDYSNLGYGVLGEVVARAAHRNLSAVLQEALFKPLGMSKSSVGPSPHLSKETAARYSHTRGRRPSAISATPGASMAYSKSTTCSAASQTLAGG